MKAISEDNVEQAMLEWLAVLGGAIAHAPDISPLSRPRYCLRPDRKQGFAKQAA